MRNILTAISLTIGLGIVGVIAFIVGRSALEAWLGVEVFKLSYQFLLIIVIGGAISLLYSQFAKRQAEANKIKEEARAIKSERKALQRKFRTEFLQSYNAAKGIRRLLRAKARAITEVNGAKVEMIVVSPYDKQAQQLVHVQLQFETLKEEVESRKDLFSGVPELQDLYAKLGTIESYLNEIVGEYEDKFNLFHKGDLQPISLFPKLAEFIGPFETANDFKTRFKQPAKEIVGGLLKLLTDAT